MLLVLFGYLSANFVVFWQLLYSNMTFWPLLQQNVMMVGLNVTMVTI